MANYSPMEESLFCLTLMKALSNISPTMYIRFPIISLILSITMLPFIGCAPFPDNNGLGETAYIKHYEYAGNIWDEMSQSFHLPSDTTTIPQVRDQINWLVSHPTYLTQTAKQSQPYLYYIFKQVKTRNIPPEIALLPLVESAYDPFAYSHVGAAGLWQLMPGTASGLGLKVDWWYDGRRDIVASTKAALDYLEYLANFFDGDWLLALAAYDCGEGAVRNAIKQNMKEGKLTDFWSLDLPGETKNYLPRLLAVATIIKYIDEYPVDLPYIKNSPHLTEIEIGSQIDIAQAAKMATMDIKAFSNLNPGFNRWATDPEGPHQIILPIDKASHFKKELEKLPKEKRVTWIRYKAQPGDSLLSIAKRFKTNVSVLQEVNHIKNKTIHRNQTLLIPTSTKNLVEGILHTPNLNYTSSRRIPEIKITKHIVKKGDSLSSIGRKYGVQPRQIRFWNGMKYRDTPKPGQNLIMWPPRKKRASPGTTYTVRPGNSLGGIARRYNISIGELKRINHLKTNLIYVGQHLKVAKSIRKKEVFHSPPKKTIKTHTVSHATSTPSPNLTKIIYRIKPGDTLSVIAEKSGVKTTELKRWNSIQDENTLKPNQMLVIYK